jgi:hypothetical protein
MHSGFAKLSQVLQWRNQSKIYSPCLTEQSEHVMIALRHTKTLSPDEMLPHAQRCLTGTHGIQDRGVLPGTVSTEAAGILFELITCPLYTTLNDGSFIDQHVINH